MVNFNYTSQEFWVSIETLPLFLFVCVFIPYIYLLTEHKYTPMAQVFSSNRNECSSVMLSYDHTVGWIRNSGLLQSETATMELWTWPCPCVYGIVVWFTSHHVTLPTNGILRKMQSDENTFCVVLERELCQSEARNNQLIIAWDVQKTEAAADRAAKVAVSVEAACWKHRERVKGSKLHEGI